MADSPVATFSRRLRESFRGKRSSEGRLEAGREPSPMKEPPPHTAADSPASKKLHRQESVLLKARPGATFTNLASLVVERAERADPNLASIGRIRHAITTGSSSQVKRLVRSNAWAVGARLRGELWKELAGRGRSLDDAALFYRGQREEMERNAPGVVPTPSFLGPHPDTGMEVERQLIRPDGVNALRRLLSILESARPDFVASPVLYPLAALALHYLDEESAYASLATLAGRGQDFILTTHIATQASMRTLVVLVRKHAKPVHGLLRSLRGAEDDEALVDVFYHWHAWIFRDLPLPHVVRVCDCFLWEGHKVLFRVALALLIRWHKANASRLKARTGLSAEEVADEVSQFVQTLPATPEKLLSVAFGVRNLQISTISALQQRHELKIRQGRPGFSYSLYRSKSQRGGAVVEVPSTGAVLGSFPPIRLNSDILSDHASTRHLLEMLPPRLQLLKPVRLFSAKQDGTSFTRLWQALDSFEGPDESILLIQTYDGEIFGGFASTSWSARLSKGGRLFFGTGESFIFRLHPAPPEKWSWVGLSGDKTSHSQDLFQAADASSLILGGGGAEALSIREELVVGHTDSSETFANPPLVPSKAFEIQHFEAFGFAEPGEE